MTVVDARAQTAAPATTAAPAAAPATVPQLPRRVGKVTAPRRDRRKASETETGWSKPLLWRVAAMIVVLIAFLTPRLIELDRMVTPDEPIWLARSANFYEALSSGDLGSTYQFAHPGVTVMWLGAAGYWWKARDYASQVDGQISQRLNRVARYLEEFGYAPLDVLVAGRIMLVLAMALVFAAAFLYALRLMTFSVAVLGFLLIALDPFALALSRLLHVDAMSAMMMLLCVLSGTVYLVRGRKRGDLLLSGIAAGLAVLTRSQMGILAVWFPLMLLIDARGWRLGGGNWIASLRSCVRPLAIWGSAAFITCVVLWPALWVDPLRVIEGMLDFAGTAAIEGHERTIVFAGELHAGDPGVRFYPATFLWRATPSVLIGITLAIVALVWARRWQVTETQRRIAISLIIAAGSYGLLMSAAAKKFDRYLLPVYPLAALLAAWGIVVAADRLSGRLPAPRWVPAAVAGSLALLVQISGVTATAPYYLSYYNPMLGGSAAAKDSMMVGWGEGLDQIGAFLNDLPEGAEIVVASEVWPSTLSYFLDEEVRRAAFVDDPKGIYRWARSDYYVLYITPLEREDVIQPWLDLLQQKEPLLVVTLNGLEYARLYDIRDDPLPDYLVRGRSGMALWDGLGRMVASSRADRDRVAFPGGELNETVYFDQLATEDLQQLADSFTVRLMLIDPEGKVVREIVEPLALTPAARHGLFEWQEPFTIPADFAIGEYTLGIQFIDSSTGELVPGFSFRYGDRLADTVVLDTIQIVPNAAEADDLGEEEG